MTNLIKFNSLLALDNHLKEDPFAYLFLSHLTPNLSVTAKTQYLKEFALALGKLEAHVENTQARNHWLCITSGFSAAITVAGSTALIPIAGVILSGGAIVAAVGTIIDAVVTKNQVESLAQTLKRHRLALNSQESQQWAALWEYAESDLFLRSLDYASDGFVVGDKLVQRGDDSPFMRAVAFIAECKGMQYVEVIEAARAALAKPAVAVSGKGEQEKPMLPTAEPARPQEPTSREHEPEVQPPQPTKKATQSQPIDAERSRSITVALFDFERLRSEPDKFAHLRVIGGTGIGKTTFVDWLLDILGGSRFVITPKKKSWNWVGLKVYGLWFDYETIRAKLQWIHAEMYRRYPLMSQGQTFEVTNFVVDEWRLINTNVKAIKERDPETKQTIEIAPSAKAMMKDIITVARESMLRLIALAQGENVASWGFEGESDLEECFTDIRLGEFAIDYAKSLRNQCRKDSDDYEYWTAVLAELDWQQSRRTREGKSIACCMVGKYPARIPDLSDWKREVADIDSGNPEDKEQPAAKKEAAIFASEGAIAQPEQPTTVLKVSDSLGEPLKTIWLFTKERADWVTVRDVQRKDFATLKGKNSEQIHQYLGLLADSGYGEIDEEGKSHSSVRFRAH